MKAFFYTSCWLLCLTLARPIDFISLLLAGVSDWTKLFMLLISEGCHCIHGEKLFITSVMEIQFCARINELKYNLKQMNKNAIFGGLICAVSISYTR